MPDTPTSGTPSAGRSQPENPLPGQQRFIASAEETPLAETGAVVDTGPPESVWKEAWGQLRHNWIFWAAVLVLAVVALAVIWPSLFTSVDPNRAQLSKSLDGPSEGAIAGYNKQGYDVFARTIYGARASVLVGVLCTVVVLVVGLLVGAVAGFYGGIVDSILSRLADIFFGIPLLLGALIALTTINNMFPNRGYFPAIFAVVIALAAFAWPQMSRIARGAVMEAKNMEFVEAAKAIGASPTRNLFRHVIPNSLPPVIVTATISLGIYIVSEATLSFLGIGLPFGVVSWGNDIAAAQIQIRSGQRLGVLFWPAGALAITALGFILLGDAVSDALDPKQRRTK